MKMINENNVFETEVLGICGKYGELILKSVFNCWKVYVEIPESHEMKFHGFLKKIDGETPEETYKRFFDNPYDYDENDY